MRFFRAVIYILLLVIVAYSAAPYIGEFRKENVRVAQIASSSPEVLVREIITNVFDAVNANRKAKKGDSVELNRIAETLIAPFCDFEKMTSAVVGPAWRSATKKEREELVSEFRTLLMKLYSGTLREYADYSFSIMSRPTLPTATEATIKVELSRLAGEGAAPINISAYLEKGSDGRWRIVDISMNGISVLMSYRTGFQDVIKNAGVQGLIDHLRDLNTKANKKK